jgi:hypothetical protein
MKASASAAPAMRAVLSNREATPERSRGTLATATLLTDLGASRDALAQAKPLRRRRR